MTEGAVCAAILRTLVKRGLRLEPGLLCVIDGAKGLRTAIRMDHLAHVGPKTALGCQCAESHQASPAADQRLPPSPAVAGGTAGQDREG
jgi:hypothetical protein